MSDSAPCPAVAWRPQHGDLTCIYPEGHEQPHRSLEGYNWIGDTGRHVGAHHPIGSRCTLPHCPRVHDPEFRDLVAERLNAEEAIAGPRVAGRRAGKTSEQLDVMTRHANALAAELAEERAEHRATAHRHAAAVEYAETLERRLSYIAAVANGDTYPDPDEPTEAAVCGDTIGPVPKLDGAVMTCTRPAGHADEHYDGNASWADRPACPATLDVNYGEQGQVLPCQLIGHHEEHVANTAAAQYRWEA